MAGQTFYLLAQNGLTQGLTLFEIEGAHTYQTAKAKAFNLISHGCSGFLVIEDTKLIELAAGIPKATRKVIGQTGANPAVII